MGAEGGEGVVGSGGIETRDVNGRYVVPIGMGGGVSIGGDGGQGRNI